MTLAEIKQQYLSRATLSGDVWGGLAAMLVALPSAIAFGVTIFAPLGGSLAAQGAIAGIIGATVLGLISPVFGGSTRLISAPCAPAAAVLSALAVTFTQQGIPAASVLLLLSLIALLAGIIQIGFGVLGIGNLIKFIPFPVVSGYLSGVGLIIIGSQVPKFLGMPSGTHLIDALITPSGWLWQPILIGAVVMATMILIPRVTHAIPAAIVALLAGISCYFVLAWFNPALMSTQNNPLLVGSLGGDSGGLMESLYQHWHVMAALDPNYLIKIFLPALTLAALLSIDTLKTCLVVDSMTSTHHQSNRELMGQGLGNIASSLVGGIPGAGTMGASLINISSGGTTKLSGFMTGIFSLAAFLLLAPLIAWVPVAALAAILIVIGLRMIDTHSLKFFFNPATRLDFVVILTVILVAIFGNLISASGVGVALAILLFIREQTRSSVVRNRFEGKEYFHKHSLRVQSVESIVQNANQSVIFELQGSLFFGTANKLQQVLEKEIGERKFVILSMRRVQSLDITATHVLEQIKDRLEACDAYLVFCDIPKDLPSGLKMKRFLKDTGVVRSTNKAFAFKKLDEALDWVISHGEVASATPPQTEFDMFKMPIFSGQNKEAVRALEALMEVRSFNSGEQVFSAGKKDEELLIVRQGAIKVTVPVPGRDDYHLISCGMGEIVGGSGFLEGSAHITDAQALSDVEVYVLTRVNFELLSHHYPELALAIIKNMAVNLTFRLRATIAEMHALHG